VLSKEPVRTLLHSLLDLYSIYERTYNQD